ncbi:ATP-binding protein [Solimicrobium silvestre]|uniref:histidine kinase n=1 Tax=Solimicrobium silvestre TaxID=2099400 RepID=A0A2S9GY03_9BURK|nr:ATP-binding protein [Solimicrobium silvestre]PRC92588.1 Histidine kinase [Solimicrobium silvestre]
MRPESIGKRRVKYKLSLWRNWSIRQRLLLITLLPVTYLFCMLVWHSYWLHSHEVDSEIEERGKIITKVLARSSEYELATGRLSELSLSLDSLVQSEHSIASIDILNVDKKIILHSQSADKEQFELRAFDMPIIKRLIWINVIPAQVDPSLPHETMRSGNSAQIAGYVHVVMSPSDLQRKQKHRFSLELMVAALGLLISGGLAIHLSRTLSASFKTFIEACRAIRKGNYPVQLEVSSGGEIGELQASIKEMALSLQQSTHELENKVVQRTIELENSRNEALKANDEKRKLIQKVQNIVEEERKSIALEVHDELNAALIAARLQAQRIADLAAKIPETPESEEITQHALSIKQITRNLYDNGRALVRRLRPEVLDMLGLQGAVAEMVASYSSTHPSCHFSCEVDGDFSGLDNVSAMSAYRIIQEALSNIIKHADAHQAQVLLQLDADKNTVHVRITDDGKGFVQNDITEGIGLVGIRERVFALGGQIQIESNNSADQPSGTVISIWFDAVRT